MLVAGCGKGVHVDSPASENNSTGEGSVSSTGLENSKEVGNPESSSEVGNAESITDLGVVEVEEANEESWEYYSRVGYYLIYGYIGDGKAKKVYIPETINGEPVSVELELTEESIGNIEELVIPSSVMGLSISYNGTNGGIKRITFSEGFKLTDKNNDDSALLTSNPFRDLVSLEEIAIEGENEIFYVEDGILFERVGEENIVINGFGYNNTNCMVCYPASKPGESYEQPEGVRTVADTYANTKYLKNLSNAFLSYECSAFDNSSVESIENNASTKLDYKMYDNAVNLKTVRIASDYSPARGNYFYGCTSLEQITVDDGVTSFYSDDGVLYYVDDGKYYLIEYPSAKEGETYTIMDNTKGIYIGAFESVKNLKTLIVPASASAECLGYQSDDSISKDCDFEIVYE
jgi:hypothetical protein